MAVVSFEVKNREPFAEGQEFGDVGSYERVDGVLTFAVDPLHPANAVIADLDLAPRDAEGCVRFESDVVFVTPSNPLRGNGALILDIPNRGRTISVQLNGAWDRGTRPPGPVPLEPFDGYTFNQGFSLLTVGWQTDMVPMEHALSIRPPFVDLGPNDNDWVWAELRPAVESESVEISQLGNRGYPAADPQSLDAQLYEYRYENAPARLIPRERWRFGRHNETGQVEASDSHIWLDGGFRAGRVYRVRYRGTRPPVVGAGLLALRDAASFFREGGGVGPHFDRVIGFGVSQTGRVLRTFLNFGLNADEAGQRVLDGVLIHIASGLGRGDYNNRFELPSSLAVRTFGELFPFADATGTDLHTGRTDGVLARCERARVTPKIIYMNTAYEYWISHASLTHTDAATGSDLPIHPDVRGYLIAGAQHAPGGVPQRTALPWPPGHTRYGLNVVAYAPLMRRALANLDDWVANGVEPPESRVPCTSDGTATSREAALEQYAKLPGVEPPPAAHLRTIRHLDLGPDANRGIGIFPALEGPAYACIVSVLDDDLNEVAGIRLPDVTVPVGTHVGWNVLETGNGKSEHVPVLLGMTRFFSRDEAEREALGDRRPSIAARYASREDYIERVRVEAQKLVDDRFLLQEDIDIVVENCGARYDEALRVGPYTPAD